MKINLSKIDTEAPKDIDKELLKQKGEEFEIEIDKMQEMLYAQSKKGILIVFQGMDASGKDGATKKVMGRLNPQGVKVKSFKKPTEEELKHDYLWRVHQNCPEKGMIQIFNRSHYEDVLITRHLGFVSDELAQERFQHINAFEKHLVSNGTIVLKFFLHIGKKKQKEKFVERLTDPEKHWKYNPADWDTHQNYDKYINYYEEVLENCQEIPWHIVPADSNWYKEYIIAEKIHEAMKSLNLTYPALPEEWKEEIKKYQ